jgi:hypothetical protein
MRVENNFSLAKKLIKEHHYSRTCPVGMGFVGYDGDTPAMAVVYGNITGIRMNTPGVYELRRLVKIPNCDIPLTKFLAVTLKMIRSYGVELVISYADPAHNHHGGIYRAASWYYHKKSVKGIGGFIINGVFVHRRQVYQMFGTSSYKKLKSKYDSIVYSEGKHLYWKPLTRRGNMLAKILKLEKNPYEKRTEE